MKILKIFFVTALYFISHQSLAQTPVSDTLAYLRSIEARKVELIGQPFSKLLNELKINIVEFSPIMNNPSDVKQEPTTIFSFFFPNYLEGDIYPYMSINWRSYVEIDKSFQIWKQTNTYGKWTNEAKLNYENAIIDDISVEADDSDPDAEWQPLLKTNTAVESDSAIIEQQKNIIRNLDKYTGQPFSVLWNDLPIKPKTVQCNTCGYDSNRECLTIFYYATADSLSITYFRIVWAGGIPKSETQKYQKGVIRDFSEAQEYHIYSNKVIADPVWVSPYRLYQEVGIMPVSSQPQDERINFIENK